MANGNRVLNTATQPAHDKTRFNNRVDISKNTTRQDTSKYTTRQSDSPRFKTTYETSNLKGGNSVVGVAKEAAATASSVASGAQSGSSAQQVYSVAKAEAKLLSTVPGVASAVYHKVRSNAYTPIKSNTSQMDTFERFEKATRHDNLQTFGHNWDGMEGRESLAYAHSTFKNYRYSKVLKKYESGNDVEHLFTTKKMRLGNGQYAVFNRKTGRMEIMNKSHNPFKKIRNVAKTKSVKWGLAGAPPKEEFGSDGTKLGIRTSAEKVNIKEWVKNDTNRAWLRNSASVHLHNTKTVTVKGAKLAGAGIMGAGKALGTTSKLLSGEMSVGEFQSKTLKKEISIVTKPVARKVKKMATTRVRAGAKTAWKHTGGRATKWASKKFWNSKVGKKINVVRRGVAKAKAKVKAGAQKLLSAFLKLIGTLIKQAILAMGLPLLVCLLIVIIIVSILGGWKASQTSCSGSGGTYNIPISETGPTNSMTYTCYDYWYQSGTPMVWAAGTAQRTVADSWKENGSKFDGGVAMIDDCYLIACTSKYGSVGDRVKVTLENGTEINCMIADIKSSSDSNYTEWGHKNGSCTNIVEFEVERAYALKTPYGSVALWHDNWNWNSNVVKIENLGANDTNASGCSSAGLTGEGANWRPNASNTQAWASDWNTAPGTISESGHFSGQCTWYAGGYLIEVYGLKAQYMGNGCDWVNSLTSRYKEYFVESSTPVSGAIYSFPPNSFSPVAGHVGIILDYNADTQTCTVFDGNWSGDCEPGGNYKVWTTSLSYLQEKGATFANPTQKGVELAEAKSGGSSSGGGGSGKLSDK